MHQMRRSIWAAAVAVLLLGISQAGAGELVKNGGLLC
jgi:hypothetical protein